MLASTSFTIELTDHLFLQLNIMFSCSFVLTCNRYGCDLPSVWESLVKPVFMDYVDVPHDGQSTPAATVKRQARRATAVCQVDV